MGVNRTKKRGFDGEKKDENVGEKFENKHITKRGRNILY